MFFFRSGDIQLANDTHTHFMCSSFVFYIYAADGLPQMLHSIWNYTKDSDWNDDNKHMMNS